MKKFNDVEAIGEVLDQVYGMIKKNMRPTEDADLFVIADGMDFDSYMLLAACDPQAAMDAMSGGFIKAWIEEFAKIDTKTIHVRLSKKTKTFPAIKHGGIKIVFNPDAEFSFDAYAVDGDKNCVTTLLPDHMALAAVCACFAAMDFHVDVAVAPKAC